MKIVRDLSVTSVNSGHAASWDTAWKAPLSASEPGLVLDFAAGAYGTTSGPSNLASVADFVRSSGASLYGPSGSIQTVGNDIARLQHDPASLAQTGLLLESGRSNLLTFTASPTSQTVSLAAEDHVLSFYGSGTVTLSGAYSATIPGDGAYPARKQFAFVPQAGDVTLTFSGDVTAPQLETAMLASSYIESGATPALRSDDVASVNLGGWFNASAGTIVFSGSMLDAAANDRVIELDGGDTSTRLSVLWNTTLGMPQFQVWNAGTLQAAIAPTGASVNLGETFRVVVGFAANDFVVSLNGSPVVADTLGVLPSGLATLRLGRSIWGAQGLMLAESLVYYPDRLSDAEIQALSA